MSKQNFATSLFLLVILSQFLQLNANAAPTCTELFFTPSTQNVLMKEKLRASHFQVNEKNEMIDLENQKIIGTISIVTASHLYKWAKHSNQKIWVQNGGISKIDMNEILQVPPHSYGRGYYVSTNPFDSSGFGNALTIFKTAGPITVMHFNPENYDLRNQEIYLKRLQTAGIDALECVGLNTWFSIITDKHLKIETERISDMVWLKSESLLSIIEDLNNLARSNIQKILPIILPTTKLRKVRLVNTLIQNYNHVDGKSYYLICSSIETLFETEPSIASDLKLAIKNKNDSLLAATTTDQVIAFATHALKSRDTEKAFEILVQLDFTNPKVYRDSFLMVLGGYINQPNFLQLMISKNYFMHLVDSFDGSNVNHTILIRNHLGLAPRQMSENLLRILEQKENN